MKISRFKHLQLVAPAAVLACGLILPTAAFSRSQDPQPAADNTKVNKNQTPPTADQQKMNASDRTITQEIRKAVHEDASLSTYAHNIKIISQDGKVTLRGPVRSDDEKSNIEAKAVTVAGKDNVTDELTIAPAKQ